MENLLAPCPTGPDRGGLLALACDAGPDAVLVARVGEDGAARCVAVNRRFAERFGVSTATAEAPVDVVLPGDQVASFTRAVAALCAGGIGADDAGGRVSLLSRDDGGSLLVSWTAPADDSALTEANRHLQAENLELTRSNTDLGQFAYVASHDLVEPLRMVTSYLELLSDRYAADLDEQAHRYIHFAVDGANRMRALVDDLLALAEVSSCERRVGDVDLGPLAEQVVGDLAMRMKETGATVRVGPLPVVRGDAGQLSQVLANLLRNALMFRRAAVPPDVVVTAERAGGAWRITVTDNGIGVRQEFRGQVFDMFRRLHARSTYPGTGMGLAITKRIVERHGGQVGLDAVPDGGSAFWFTVPEPLGSAIPFHRTENSDHGS